MPLPYYLMEESNGAVIAAMEALGVGKEVLCDEEYHEFEKEMLTLLEKVCAQGEGLAVAWFPHFTHAIVREIPALQSLPSCSFCQVLG